jgi:outer membrane biosynthesis protein TonB
VRDELEEREQAIANLKSELEARGEVKQLNLFPGPEPTPEPTPEPEPIPTPNPNTEIVNPESTPEPKAKPKAKAKTKTKPEPTPETKLLNPRQLAEWINNNCNPKKPVTDQNLRDWFNKKSTCTDEYRAEMQEKYGFKFSHQDSKGTCWFTLPEN